MHSDNLQELFASLSNALVLYARQWCRTPEDAVQEAFIDLSNCSSEPTYPKAWLYTTTRRKAQNIARAESRHRNHLEQLIQGRGADRADEYWLEPKTRNQIAASEVLEGLDSLCRHADAELLAERHARAQRGAGVAVLPRACDQ